MSEALRQTVSGELARPVMAEAQQLAALLAARHGDAVAAVLFYGSCLRTGDATGLLDFYVLVDSYRAFHGGRRWPALLDRLVAPRILLVGEEIGGRRLQAKVAVISTTRFRRAMSTRSLDTTLWARFCQPCALLYARDDAARHAAEDSVAAAVTAAAAWARLLAPPGADNAARWRGLFARTYGAELRVEKGEARAADIYGFDAARYDRLMDLAPPPAAQERPGAERRWAQRRLLGKPLNLLRLAKAAFTVQGGVDYIVWKLERHSGQTVTLTPWQRRHPLLAAPGLLRDLKRRGIVR